MIYRTVVLIILDGWGTGPTWGGNAITSARAPTVNWLAKQPTAQLLAAGPAVGLGQGERGNSEVGHLNLGAGRMVLQESTVVSQAIAAGQFTGNVALRDYLTEVKRRGGRLHLIGLLSRATVHSNRLHLTALLEVLKREPRLEVVFHVITDGRDSDPRDGLGQVLDLERDLQGQTRWRMATLMGRYWAMDRDRHWDRTRKAFEAIAFGRAEPVASARLTISQSYSAGVTDEFIEPRLIAPTGTKPLTGVAASDGLLFWNFRPDRMRQLVRPFTEPRFSAFERGRWPAEFTVATLTNYSAEERVPGIIPLFTRAPVAQPLAAVIAAADRTQFHVAETEKYAHVTYFFNGGREEPYGGEERLLIPSLPVPTFDRAPAMQAQKITDAILARLRKNQDALIVANYANADMVGHTGNFLATLQAIQVLDAEMRRLRESIRDGNRILMITADHGNAEEMVNPQTGEPDTSHSGNPVPCHVVTAEGVTLARRTGVLGDVAPTALELLGIPQPREMTGASLLAATGK